MVITAGQNTSLLGVRLIVDDVEPAIVYRGQRDYQDLGPYETTIDDRQQLSYPYGNGTHRTTTVGSGATFHFTGEITSVFRISST